MRSDSDNSPKVFVSQVSELVTSSLFDARSFVGRSWLPYFAATCLAVSVGISSPESAWAEGTLESVDWDNQQHKLLLRCSDSTEGKLTRVESDNLQRLIIELPPTTIGTNLPRNEVIAAHLKSSWPELRSAQVHQYVQGGPYNPIPLVRVVLDLAPSSVAPKWSTNAKKQLSLSMESSIAAISKPKPLAAASTPEAIPLRQSVAECTKFQ